MTATKSGRRKRGWVWPWGPNPKQVGGGALWQRGKSATEQALSVPGHSHWAHIQPFGSWQPPSPPGPGTRCVRHVGTWTPPEPLGPYSFLSLCALRVCLPHPPPLMLPWGISLCDCTERCTLCMVTGQPGRSRAGVQLGPSLCQVNNTEPNKCFHFIKLSCIQVCFPYLNAGAESNVFISLLVYSKLFTEYYFMCQAVRTKLWIGQARSLASRELFWQGKVRNVQKNKEHNQGLR